MLHGIRVALADRYRAPRAAPLQRVLSLGLLYQIKSEIRVQLLKTDQKPLGDFTLVGTLRNVWNHFWLSHAASWAVVCGW